MKTIKNLLFAVGILTLAVQLSAAEKIVLTGSDLLEPIISEAVKSTSAKNNIKVDISMEGTYSAFDKLKSGEADIAIIALPKTSKLPDGLAAFPIAYQAAVVIVNSINPMEEISTKQLSNIYSTATKTRAETWNQLGIKNIGLRNILAITTSLSDNVVVELFKYTALDGTNIGQWVHVADNKTDIYNMIKANNSAIAVIGKFSAANNNLVKVLAVSKSDENDSKSYAFRPDRDTIFNGDYPLTLPFYIVFPKEKMEKVRPLVRILLSNDIANKIDNTDFFSAHSSSRKKSIFDLDIPR